MDNLRTAARHNRGYMTILIIIAVIALLPTARIDRKHMPTTQPATTQLGLNGQQN